MAIDRKALTRQYKDTPRSIGVGIIRHRASGKALVVSGQDIPALLNRHMAQLRLDTHRNRALQADWNEHGADAFEFAVLDNLKPRDDPDYDPTEDLRVLEALWIEKMNSLEPAGYQPRPR